MTRHGTYRPCAVAGDGVDALSLGLQQRMGELECLVVAEAADADLVVVDGPLTRRRRCRVRWATSRATSAATCPRRTSRGRELERALRRHLGDPALLYRSLRLAALDPF